MRAYPQRRSDDDAREQQRAWTQAAPLGHGCHWLDHSGPTIVRAGLAASRFLRPAGRCAFATHAITAASVSSPSSSEPPSTGTPSRSAPCLLGSSSSAPMIFHSSGRRRTVASTSRASPPPPTNNNGLGVIFECWAKLRRPEAVDD